MHSPAGVILGHELLIPPSVLKTICFSPSALQNFSISYNFSSLPDGHIRGEHETHNGI